MGSSIDSVPGADALHLRVSLARLGKAAPALPPELPANRARMFHDYGYQWRSAHIRGANAMSSMALLSSRIDAGST